MGIDQAVIETYQEKRPAPRSIQEIIEIELKTGQSLKKLKQAGYFDEESGPEDLITHVPWS